MVSELLKSVSYLMVSELLKSDSLVDGVWVIKVCKLLDGVWVSLTVYVMVFELLKLRNPWIDLTHRHCAAAIDNKYIWYGNDLFVFMYLKRQKKGKGAFVLFNGPTRAHWLIW